MDREALIDKIHAAFVRGYSYFERDILAPRLEKYNIRGYKYDGYYARICGLKSYFDENMKLLDDENLDALFTGGTQRSVMTTRQDILTDVRQKITLWLMAA